MIVPIKIGYDKNKKVVRDLVELSHLLVCVSEKQLKELSKTDTTKLIAENDDCEVVTIDFGSKSKYDMYLAYKIVNHILEQMEERYDMLSQLKYRNILELNEKTNCRVMHLVLLAIGFPDKDFDKRNKIIKNLLRLTQLGRAAGIHFVCITDSAKKIPKLVNLNIPNKISTIDKFDGDYFCNDDDFKLERDELAFEEMWKEGLRILKYKK